jgi:hypothetical protein
MHSVCDVHLFLLQHSVSNKTSNQPIEVKEKINHNKFFYHCYNMQEVESGIRPGLRRQRGGCVSALILDLGPGGL